MAAPIVESRPRLRRSRAAFALAASLWLPASLFGAGVDSNGVDSSGALVARALFEEARTAAGIGDWETARACLDEASIKDPTDADILYLSALASLKKPEPYEAALGKLDASLATGRFSTYSMRDSRILKAELLVRERRWKSALDTLGSPDPQALVDPSYALVRARALSGSGDERAFGTAIAEALRRFPDESAFARLFFERAKAMPASVQDRDNCSLILSRLSRYAEIDPELPVLAAPFMPDNKAREDAVLAFRAAGRSSAAATLRALDYGIVSESVAASEMLSGAYPLILGDLEALYALAGSKAGREAIFAALASWSGTVLVDSDKDGQFEGSFSLSSGLVTGWKRDSKQEGLIDESAVFESGLPSAFTIERGKLEMSISYSSYPAVSRLAFIDADSRRSYSFGPGDFAYAPLSMRPFAGEGRAALYFPYARASADPSEAKAASTALSVETSSGDRRSLSLLDKGRPLSEESFQGGRLLSKKSFDKGHPLLELSDVDGDGRFETRREFAKNPRGDWKIEVTRIDSDGDGVFEYSEAASFPFAKEWDYDGDGAIDARQAELPDGSIERDFSSRLDGRLDESLVIKDGRIVSLSREGRAIALVPDSNPILTWIGQKIFDLGSNLPEGEGVFSHIGGRYRLIRVGSLAFAELIP
jgi:hypothetical protein